MSRALGKITRRGLLRAPGRFIALFLIIVLGAGFLAGLQSTAPDMVATADKYFVDKNLADFRLACDLGITEDDVGAARALPEVAQASGTYRVDLKGAINETSAIYAIHSLPSDVASGTYLSQLALQEGRLPEQPEECVADSYSSIQIGDRIVLAEDNPSGSLEMLSPRTLTVVGLARSSAYVSTTRGNSGIGSGRVNNFLYVQEAAFTSEYYTGIELRLTSTEGLSAFSKKYTEAIEEGRAVLEEFTQRRAELRRDDITAEVETNLDEAEAELETESTQVETDLASAQEALESGLISRDEGLRRYEESSITLARSRRELDQGWTNLSVSQQEISTLQTTFEASQSAVAGGRATLQELTQQRDALKTALAFENDSAAAATLQIQIDALQAQIDPLSSQISAGETELAKAEEQLSSAQAAYAEAESQLQRGEQEYRAGENALWNLYYQIERATEQLNSGQQEYDQQSAEATDALEEARAELDQNRNELETLALPAWSIEERKDFPGYANFSADKDRIANLSLVLPWFFFLVASIVCLTTMTRMVEEQRVQIGTLKACGYRREQIAFGYQAYAWLIGLSGGALGVAIGVALFPQAIWSSYTAVYLMEPFQSILAPLPCLVGLLGGAIALSLATAFACRNTLDREAAELMRPRAPKAGKRVFLERWQGLWARIPFSRKVTIRNLFRYRTRFVVTVLGVAGCAALLLAGFGLRDSIASEVEMQYGSEGVFHLRATLALNNASGSQEDTELNKALEGVADTYTHIENLTVSFGGKTNGDVVTYLSVPEDIDSFGEFITLRQPSDHEPIAFPSTMPDSTTGVGDRPAVVITEQLANRLGIKVGDEISFGPPTGIPAKARVSGIAENYVYNYVYLSPQNYRTLFGAEPEYRSIYLMSDLPEDDFEELLTKLVATDNVATAFPVSSFRDVVDLVIANMSTVISLMIGAAFILAAVVLYNLISIMVLERQREFATMKVLGYHRGQVAAFLSRETTVMTFIGLILGLPLGLWLHGYVMATIEVNELMFSRVILPLSFVFAIVFPLICNYVVNLCVRPRLNRLDPAKVLKSIE
ncbi:MAG: ABC transporter permease [Coriobacteriales bacterium]|jgi:putative ABC transport system permease protein|nr:ABC transporter permease [Coriobacteriales bacterium]